LAAETKKKKTAGGGDDRAAVPAEPSACLPCAACSSGNVRSQARLKTARRYYLVMNCRVMNFSRTSILEAYEMGATIGQGSFAVVKLCKNRKTGEEVAIKIIEKKNARAVEDLQKEAEVMAKIEHPNVIRVYQIFENSTKCYMVQQYVSGGEMFDRIIEKDHFSEVEAVSVLKQILEAVQYLHSCGVVHRDIKPENLLYKTRSADAPIMLADFGLAKVLAEGQEMHTMCGTPGYVAPEILSGKAGYTSACDIWSIGVVAYILLCGFPPFYDESTPALVQQIVSGKYEFPSPWWDAVSENAKSFVRFLLNTDPVSRPSAEQALGHPWMTSEASSTALSGAISKLKESAAKKKLKKVRELCPPAALPGAPTARCGAR
jgi:calcium/calmodulin-dependent protein kinase I